MNAPCLRHLNQSIVLLAVAVLIVAAIGCGEQEPEHASHAGEASASAIMATHKHDDPNGTCFMCDPSKRDKRRLWCKEHVRYEDRCWLCHPGLEDKDRLYCQEHSLYEDECSLCHPELKRDNGAGQEGHDHEDHNHGTRDAGAHDGLFCNEHGVYEAECAICQPDRVTLLKPGENLKIRFPSTASAEKAGIRTSRAQPSQSTPSVETLCEVQYNLNTMARVTPLADGVIRRVKHDVGDRVEAGDVLVELHSADVASAKSDYLAARVDRDIRQQVFEREKRLREQNIVAEKDYLEARAALRTADLVVNNLHQRLINLGFTEDRVEQIKQDQDTSARLEVRAPFAGTIVERDAVVGESVEVGRPVFTVADLSSRWLILSTPARHTPYVRTGQQLTAQFEELPGTRVSGKITWIDTSIDPRSRMVKARALVTDGAEQIKTGLFGKAKIMFDDRRPVTIVPRDAVQRHQGGTFVFVQDEVDLFSIRRVALGQSHGQTIEVLAGLAANDPVVTEGSFVVMSEFLKSRLGAGCAGH